MPIKHRSYDRFSGHSLSELLISAIKITGLQKSGTVPLNSCLNTLAHNVETI